MFLLSVSFLVVFLTFFYYYIIKPHSYWKNIGVTQTNPAIFFGDLWPLLTGKKNAADFIEDIYKAFDGERYIGFYQFLSPTLMIRDPELIKRITVKDFDSFMNHNIHITEEADPHFAKNLFMLKDQRWKDMRATLSPCFSSGKIKLMFPLIADCVENYVEHLRGIKENEDNIKEVELKEVSEKFATNTIATTAFGIRIDSFKNPGNEFYQQVQKISPFSFLQQIIFACYMSKNMFTNLLLYLKCSIFPKSVYKFFDKVISETISVREREEIIRPDMLQLLMQARRGTDNDSLEDDVKDTSFATFKSEDTRKLGRQLKLGPQDITAQALVFFVAGFSSTSMLLNYLIHELTVNQDVQDRLRKEIHEALEKSGGKINYETLMGMKYLDSVVTEALRKIPNSHVDRVVTKPYTIEPERPGEKPVHLKAGDMVWIPLAGLHTDPTYFPEADKFKPDRFSEENRANFNAYTYLPFGIGPRMCIANRWAILVNKITAFSLIENFQFVPVEKTEIPLKFGSGFIPFPKNGIWVGLKNLKTQN